MSGALRKGFFASGVWGAAGFLLAVACSEQGADQRATEQPLAKGEAAQVTRRPARADLASLTSKATVQLTSNGKALVPVSRSRAGDSSSLSLGMELPIAADGAVRLHPSSHP